MSQWIFQYASFSAHMHTSLLCIYFEVKYVDQRFFTCSMFHKWFPKWLSQFLFPPKIDSCSISSSTFDISRWHSWSLVFFLKVMLVDLERELLSFYLHFSLTIETEHSVICLLVIMYFVYFKLDYLSFS